MPYGTADAHIEALAKRMRKWKMDNRHLIGDACPPFPLTRDEVTLLLSHFAHSGHIEREEDI